MREEVRKTIDCLREAKARPDVVVMPDFFIDRIVSFDGSIEELMEDILAVAEQGGGNIPKTRQKVLRGGNAANTASALASLGARAHLIARTDPTGFQLLRQFLGKKVDLSHVRVDGELALTVALEALHEGRKVNVMLTDPGSVANFRFKDLMKSDLSLIEAADYVCVFNWNQNRYGTELAKGVFERAEGKRFFDTGDPSPKKADVKKLMDEVLRRGLVDVLSLNENEAAWYASYFDPSIRRKRRTARLGALAMRCAWILHENLDIMIDLHTGDYSLSIVNGEEYIAPAFDVEVRRTTGAGDAWNAADIYAHAAGFPHLNRLILANASAAYYISNPEGRHPTRGELVEFLTTTHETKTEKLLKNDDNSMEED